MDLNESLSIQHCIWVKILWKVTTFFKYLFLFFPKPYFCWDQIYSAESWENISAIWMKLLNISITCITTENKKLIWIPFELIKGLFELFVTLPLAIDETSQFCCHLALKPEGLHVPSFCIFVSRHAYTCWSTSSIYITHIFMIVCH